MDEIDGLWVGYPYAEDELHLVVTDEDGDRTHYRDSEDWQDAVAACGRRTGAETAALDAVRKARRAPRND